MAHAVDRQRRIAHLAVHGWEPVQNRGTGRAGIWSEQLGVGFSCRDDSNPKPTKFDPLAQGGDSSVKHLDRDARANDYVNCEWDEVTDWHLDTIDKRLAET